MPGTPRLHSLVGAYRAQAAQVRCTVDADGMKPLRGGLAKISQMLQFIVHRASLRWLNEVFGINREQVSEECSGVGKYAAFAIDPDEGHPENRALASVSVALPGRDGMQKGCKSSPS